jgi:acetylornithine deacetylase/succinyl-diaminopimelate desuccinylase-like protein
MAARLDRPALLRFAERHRSRYEEVLAALVETPTVSTDPAHRADVERGAELGARAIRGLGGAATIVPTGGHPLVHGRFGDDPRRPTVVFLQEKRI